MHCRFLLIQIEVCNYNILEKQLFSVALYALCGDLRLDYFTCMFTLQRQFFASVTRGRLIRALSVPISQDRDERKPLIPHPNPDSKPSNGTERNCASLPSARTDEQALLSSILTKTALYGQKRNYNKRNSDDSYSVGCTFY